jgi:hypothetical protein
MSNPTLSAGTQFIAPFNILPDVIYTNLTKKKSQFTSKHADWANWTPGTALSTNIDGKSIVTNLVGAAALVGASGLGIPQVSQFAQSTIQNISTINHTALSTTPYSTLMLDQLKPFPGVLYSDFRSRRVLGKTLKSISNIRVDGASALMRGGWLGGIYAAASATPFGAYSVFNLNGVGLTGYGWGDHDNPYAIRNDFTARSHVAKRWVSPKDAVADGPDPKPGDYKLITKGRWLPTVNPLEKLMPFRGDRVSVIDFGRRRMSEAYLWNPNIFGATGKFGAILNKAGITQDFIKFYMTGPKLFNGAPDDVTDDIMVFRATINSLSDSFNANWTPVTMVGRADPNYQYTGFGRDLNLDFTVYATDRDEMQPIWRKLNALAGFTAPTYDLDSIALRAPWMRITIGDLFVQTPVILTSVSFTLHDADTTWEINLEHDPTMMQAPHKVSVSCTFTVIGDDLPQKNGRFYTLAKEFDASGSAKPGNRNWLSDSLGNSDIVSEQQKKFEKSRKTGTIGGTESVDPTGTVGKQVVGFDASKSMFN